MVHTQPNARSTEIVGLHDGRLKIRVAAPASDGRANTLLIDFLRRRLDLPAQRIALIQGQRSRGKTIEIAQPTAEIIAALSSWAIP